MKLHMQILIALGLGIKRNGHIFFGLIAGIIVGVLLHAQNAGTPDATPLFHYIFGALNFIGQAFIRLIQMVIIPLIFSAIIIGISSIGDNKQLGSFGRRMILYYTIISVAAVIIGTILSLGVKPGLGVQSYINAQSAIAVLYWQRQFYTFSHRRTAFSVVRFSRTTQPHPLFSAFALSHSNTGGDFLCRSKRK